MTSIISPFCFPISAFSHVQSYLEARDKELSDIPVVVVLWVLAVLWKYCELSVIFKIFKIILAGIFVYFVLIAFHEESCKSCVCRLGVHSYFGIVSLATFLNSVFVGITVTYLW